VGLIVYRLQRSQDDAALLAFFIGGRYFIFPSFFIVLALASFLTTGARAVAALASVGAVVASSVFFATTGPRLWPHLLVDHASAWQEIVTKVKLEQAASRPLRNESLKHLDPEFQSDLKLRRHMLEWSLRCTDCVSFEADEAPPVTR
jgi:cytochrome bd-type quinol oxidase subunit 2